MATPKNDASGIRQTIRALKVAGYRLDSVNDGEEDRSVDTESDALAAIVAVDDAYLFVTHTTDGHSGWVRFVLGNDPDEVICDHTVNLSHVLDPLMDSWDE